MSLATHIDEFEPPEHRRCAVTFGSFDGLHRGHQAIVARLVSVCNDSGATPVMLTFDPHPAVVLGRVEEPFTITTLDEKVALASCCGVESVVVQPFNEAFSERSADEFVRNLLLDTLHASAVVVGEDAGYGRGRSGDVNHLTELGERLGFDVCTVSNFRYAETEVRSSVVRESLRAGDVRRAVVLLGHPYYVVGDVERGKGRGAGMGYATANLVVDKQLLVPNGVYAARAVVGDWQSHGPRHDGIVYIGRNLTFGETQQVCELHLFDFESSLYDERVTMELWDRIRGEIKFSSAEELEHQIAADVREARQALSNVEVAIDPLRRPVRPTGSPS